MSITFKVKILKNLESESLSNSTPHYFIVIFDFLDIVYIKLNSCLGNSFKLKEVNNIFKSSNISENFLTACWLRLLFSPLHKN